VAAQRAGGLQSSYYLLGYPMPSGPVWIYLRPSRLVGENARLVFWEDTEAEGGLVLICFGIVGIAVSDVVREVLVDLAREKM
jgi:hypothetical protein